MSDDFAPTQERRLLRLSTPLGGETLLPTGMHATERVSGPFRVTVDAAALHADADSVTPGALLGKTARISLAGRELGSELDYAGDLTHFHGVVTRLVPGPSDEHLRHFELELSPWLWLLTQSSDSRVYQDKDVKEVVSAVFDDLKGKGFDCVDYDFRLKGSYTKQDYCVQYRETHFNFVSRLLEQEGLHYFFEHAEDGHKLVVTDDPGQNGECEGGAEFRLHADAGFGAYDEDLLDAFAAAEAVRPGRAVLRDYQFQMADRVYQATEAGESGGNNGELEIFDYPGEFAQRFNKPDERLGDVGEEGKFLAGLRAEEGAARRRESAGAGHARGMRPGRTFAVTGKDGETVAESELLVAVTHTATQDPPYHSGWGDGGEPYSNSFTSVPHDLSRPFRPARATPKPAIAGMQTAEVVGPSGEEIHVDKYGRVKVQFHWDRVGKKDDASSCYLRVAQSWAGAGWGAHFWPRVGQEVLVAFMEGDPDHPIVVGSVYNSKHMPPYPLPDHKTRSGVKTQTYKGSAQEFNELRFEDRRGEEEIYVHAEKDFNAVVENNETRKVGFEAQESAGAGMPEGNQTEEVWNNRATTVGAGEIEAPPGGGMDELTVFNGQNIQIGHVAASDGGQTIKIVKDRSVTLDMGSDTLDIKLGKREVSALQSIELKCGASSIKLTPASVEITAPSVTLNGSLKTDVKAGGMMNVTASGILSMGGSLTKIG